MNWTWTWLNHGEKHTQGKTTAQFFGKQSPKRSISLGPLLPSHPPSRDSWAATCLIDQWSSGSPKGETQCYRPVTVTWCHMVTAGMGKWKVCSPLQQWKSANTTKTGRLSNKTQESMSAKCRTCHWSDKDPANQLVRFIKHNINQQEIYLQSTGEYLIRTNLEFPWNNWVLIVFHPNNQTRPLVNVAQNGESVKTHRSAGWWTRLQLGRRKARSANITGDLAVEIWFLFIWFCWVTGFQLKVWGFQLRVGKNEINMMISQTLDYGTIWYDFTWNDMMWSMNELFIQICMIIWLEFCMNKLCFWWT